MHVQFNQLFRKETAEKLLDLITGLPMANQLESVFSFVFFYWVAYGKPVEVCVDFVVFLFFSVLGKFLPVTPLLSGVHRVFSAYFVRFEGAGVMRSLLCTINL